MNGMVVAPQVQAAETCIEVLRRGGNAVDAAVTAAFVQGVVDPHMCGLGGGGLMTVHYAESDEDVVLEFLPRAGSLVREDQWAGAFLRPAAHAYGYVVEGARNEVGYESIGIPGTVGGLYEALRRFGTIGWEDAIIPAATIAGDGFRVSSFMRQDWEFDTGPDVVPHRKRLQVTSEARRIFTKNGCLYDVGERLVLSDMAETLRQLASDGPETFYRGKIAVAMASDFEANGATVTAEDLAHYQVRVTAPVLGSFGDTTIVTPPPPAGGTALLQLLNYLEQCDLPPGGWPSAAEARARADAMAWVFAEQQRYMADPHFCPVPVACLVAKDYAAQARDRGLGDGPVERQPLVDVPTTTQLSVVDGAGNAVSLTHTLGTWSGVVTPGLGFGYNNYLNAFDPRPGHVNSLAPGKARVTMMAPSLLYRGQELTGAVGGVGGNKILTGVGQSLVNLIHHGMTPVEAVNAPRVHRDMGGLQAEGRLPSDIVWELHRDGYQVTRRAMNYDIYFALVQLIARGADDRLRGASDPRGDGGMPLEA